VLPVCLLMGAPVHFAIDQSNAITHLNNLGGWTWFSAVSQYRQIGILAM
jgi:hypothetical protein